MSGEKQYALASIFGPGRDELIDHTPHARHLGIRVVRTGPCEAVLKLPYRAELVGDPTRGVVFGGAITTLLDHCSGLAAACAMETFQAIATVDLRVDYLRAAAPGLDLYGHVTCYKMTKNVAFIRGVAYEHDPADPFASCQGTLMVGANPTASPFNRFIGEGTEETSG